MVVGVDVVAEAADTVTIVLALVVPPAPVQLKLYVEVVLSAPVEDEPLVALLPLQAPLAVQLAALLEVHVILALKPAINAVGEALSATVGAGVKVTVSP